jgi:hypothetical protein
MRMGKRIGVVFLSGCLAACASLPTARVSGALAPGGYAFSETAASDQGQLRTLVAERLSADGLHPAAPATADYIVYLGYSAVPVQAGLYMPPATAPQGPPGDWVVDPRNGKKMHLQVVVIERAGGKVVFDGGATLTGPGRKAKTALPQLVDAALGVGPSAKP